jgi:hypothetical protein
MERLVTVFWKETTPMLRAAKLIPPRASFRRRPNPISQYSLLDGTDE